MAETKTSAVECRRCHGTGKTQYTYTPFTRRKTNIGDIQWVYQYNPGIKIGDGNGFKLSDFGGIPVEEWYDNKAFPLGSEMRNYTCPKWWFRNTGKLHPNGWWDGWPCTSMHLWGKCFSDCFYFPKKEDCWKRYDIQILEKEK